MLTYSISHTHADFGRKNTKNSRENSKKRRKWPFFSVFEVNFSGSFEFTQLQNAFRGSFWVAIGLRSTLVCARKGNTVKSEVSDGLCLHF